MALIAEAIRLSKSLPLGESLTSSSDDTDYIQARTCGAWTIHHVDVACSRGLLNLSQPIDPRLGILPNLADVDFTWSGKPYTSTTVRFRRNALFRETCALVRLESRVNELLFSETRTRYEEDFPAIVKGLMGQLLLWNDMLPSDLQHYRNLPAPLYELQYVCETLFLCPSALFNIPV